MFEYDNIIKIKSWYTTTKPILKKNSNRKYDFCLPKEIINWYPDSLPKEIAEVLTLFCPDQSLGVEDMIDLYNLQKKREG